MELIAKEKILEIYIDSLLGEFGFDKDGKIKNIKDMLKEEFVFIYGEEKDIEKYFAPPIKKEEKKKLEIPNIIKKFFDYFGINPSFFKAAGPYEYNLSYRLAKYYLKVAGGTFSQIKNYFHASFQVPGAQVEVRV
jgi:hypothetical protein